MYNKLASSFNSDSNSIVNQKRNKVGIIKITCSKILKMNFSRTHECKLKNHK